MLVKIFASQFINITHTLTGIMSNKITKIYIYYVSIYII